MHAGTLAIALDGDAEPQLLVALRGTGRPAPAMPVPDPPVPDPPAPDPGADPDRGCSAGRGPGSAGLALGVLGLIVRRRRRA